MSPFQRFFPILLVALVPALVMADPPARVGRLALVENDVSFSANRESPGVAANINWPLSSGALLDTGQRGRAEAWVGATAFRLAPHSQLEFSVVDDRQVVVRLLDGSLAVSILEREQSDDVTVQTPEGRVRFLAAGRYRIDVRADHTELTAQAGQASFDDGERGVPVMAGQKVLLYGNGRMQAGGDGEQDVFDEWVAERENMALAGTARRYVSPAMTGYQDLDRYGDWSTLPEYGAVWYPRSVAADWAPYRFGRWAWVDPWGWTWIDQAPWGFAPFHYGRWIEVRGRWGWVPGTYVARPVYAPALVAWIGDAGWSVGFSFGAAPAVGWFPLAPREVYVPGFHASSDYVHRLNRAHVRDLAAIDRVVRDGPRRPYAYRALPRAVTIVPSRDLRDGRQIRPGELGHHERRDLERAPSPRAQPAIAPNLPGERPGRPEIRREARPPITRPSVEPPARRDDGAPPSGPAPRAPAAARPGNERPRNDFGRDGEAVRRVAPAPVADRERNREEKRQPAMPAVEPGARPMQPAAGERGERGRREMPELPRRDARPEAARENGGPHPRVGGEAPAMQRSGGGGNGERRRDSGEKRGSGRD